MTHVQTENIGSDGMTDELLPAKVKRLYGKHGDSTAERQATKRFKKHKPRQRKIAKLVKPVASVASDFVSSSRRLTRRIGLFSNGKISTKVSRFEYTASAETKARVEQDLHTILNLSGNNHTVTVENDISQVPHNVDVSTKQCSCRCKSVDNNKENSLMQHTSPVNCDVATSHQNNSDIFISSDKNTGTLTSSQTKNLDAQKRCDSSPKPKVQLSDVITRLHVTLNKKREELFPNVSLKKNFRNELTALQRHFIVSRTEWSDAESLPCSAPSQSNTSLKTGTCSKSQAGHHDDPQSFKLDFCPRSLSCSSPVKDWLFPESSEEGRIFADQEKELHEEKQLIYNGAVFDDSYSFPSSPCKSKSSKLTLLSSASPDSDGQPVWKVNFSPYRLPTESPVSSWNYSRCKMY